MRNTALFRIPIPHTRLIRRAARDKPRTLIAASAVVLVPWTVVLAATLPGTTEVQNWSTAWVGLDLLLAVGCGLTTMLLRRNDSRARLVAAAVAGVAMVDTWFDLITAQPGAPFAQAVLCAVGQSLLIAACMHVALTPGQEAPRPERITVSS
ncbi:hypothetical protein ACQPW1_36490 [Nocardia sp. CA-128927]|uniref:hypothetical protein n=1 Tax=Nocardia sp. CA-128927 TaxID=3239975 RepID=UPI003D959291